MIKKLLYKSSLVAFALVFVLPMHVFALNPIDYPANDVLWYAREDCKSGGGVGTTTGTLSGKDNAQKIWNYFKGKGFSDEQTAGILGNFSRESGFMPNRVQGAGIKTSDTLPTGPGGYGLAQWDDRKPLLGKFAQEQGKPVSDLGLQLDFVMYELAGPESGANSAFKNVKSVEEATRVWMDRYERPGDKAFPDRLNAANLAMKEFGGSGGGATTTTPATGTTPLPNPPGVV